MDAYLVFDARILRVARHVFVFFTNAFPETFIFDLVAGISM